MLSSVDWSLHCKSTRQILNKLIFFALYGPSSYLPTIKTKPVVMTNALLMIRSNGTGPNNVRICHRSSRYQRFLYKSQFFDIMQLERERKLNEERFTAIHTGIEEVSLFSRRYFRNRHSFVRLRFEILSENEVLLDMHRVSNKWVIDFGKRLRAHWPPNQTIWW